MSSAFECSQSLQNLLEPCTQLMARPKMSFTHCEGGWRTLLVTPTKHHQSVSALLPDWNNSLIENKSLICLLRSLNHFIGIFLSCLFCKTLSHTELWVWINGIFMNSAKIQLGRGFLGWFVTKTRKQTDTWGRNGSRAGSPFASQDPWAQFISSNTPQRTQKAPKPPSEGSLYLKWLFKSQKWGSWQQSFVQPLWGADSGAFFLMEA